MGSLQDGKWTVGIELVEPVSNFWKINFPACAPKQLTTIDSPVETAARGTGSRIRKITEAG